MSNYYLKAKNKKTGEIKEFLAMDDYFGKHNYGYTDKIKQGEEVYDQYDFDELFEKVEENKDNKIEEKKCKHCWQEKYKEEKEIDHLDCENCCQCGISYQVWKGGVADEVKDTSLEDWEERFEKECMETSALVGLSGGRKIFVKDFISKEIKATEQKVRGEIVGILEKEMGQGHSVETGATISDIIKTITDK